MGGEMISSWGHQKSMIGGPGGGLIGLHKNCVNQLYILLKNMLMERGIASCRRQLGMNTQILTNYLYSCFMFGFKLLEESATAKKKSYKNKYTKRHCFI